MPKRTLAVLCMFLAMGFWGLSVPGIKAIAADVPPLTLALLRFVVASLVFVVVLRVSRPSLPAGVKLPWLRLFAMGLSGIAAFYAFLHLGLTYTTATAMGLITGGGIPALTALLSLLFLGERVDRRLVGGLAAAIVGVAIVMLSDQGGPGAANFWLGNLLALGSALSWAVYTVLDKDLGAGLPPVVVTGYVILFGTLALVPLGSYEVARGSLEAMTPGGWLAVVGLALGPSCASFFLWTYALRYLGASEAGSYTCLSPVFALLGAAFLLREDILLPQLLGGALTLAGVYFASRPAAASRKPGQAPLPEPSQPG